MMLVGLMISLKAQASISFYFKDGDSGKCIFIITESFGQTLYLSVDSQWQDSGVGLPEIFRNFQNFIAEADSNNLLRILEGETDAQIIIPFPGYFDINTNLENNEIIGVLVELDGNQDRNDVLGFNFSDFASGLAQYRPAEEQMALNSGIPLLNPASVFTNPEVLGRITDIYRNRRTPNEWNNPDCTYPIARALEIDEEGSTRVTATAAVRLGLDQNQNGYDRLTVLMISTDEASIDQDSVLINVRPLTREGKKLMLESRRKRSLTRRCQLIKEAERKRKADQRGNLQKEPSETSPIKRSKAEPSADEFIIITTILGLIWIQTQFL